ncbi:MAG: T9SS type A sorting domain-containing protein [Crocinitomicaceae bacterium]
MTGKLVSSSQIASKEGSNLIILPTDGFSSGTYFVKLGNNSKALKFVVK